MQEAGEEEESSIVFKTILELFLQNQMNFFASNLPPLLVRNWSSNLDFNSKETQVYTQVQNWT
jgi:hypothetical protein